VIQPQQPDGLGFLPVAVWAAMAALGIGAGAGVYGTRKVDELTAPPLSIDLQVPPLGPAAPETRDQLTRPGSWTPELMEIRTTQNLQNWSTGFRAGTQALSPSLTAAGQPGSDNTVLWVLGGLAVVAVIVATRR